MNLEFERYLVVFSLYLLNKKIGLVIDLWFKLISFCFVWANENSNLWLFFINIVTSWKNLSNVEIFLQCYFFLAVLFVCKEICKTREKWAFLLSSSFVTHPFFRLLIFSLNLSQMSPLLFFFFFSYLWVIFLESGHF